MSCRNFWEERGLDFFWFPIREFFEIFPSSQNRIFVAFKLMIQWEIGFAPLCILSRNRQFLEISKTKKSLNSLTRSLNYHRNYLYPTQQRSITQFTLNSIERALWLVLLKPKVQLIDSFSLLMISNNHHQRILHLEIEFLAIPFLF